jgi:transcriptional antiterminator NusG
MVTNDAQWFLVYVVPGREDRVKFNLEQRIKTMDVEGKIFSVIVPVVNEFEIRGGKKRAVARKAFPGYIMVQMAYDEVCWEVIKGTPGVIGFTGPNRTPEPMRPGEVSAILDRMRDVPTEIRISFKVGDSVKVADGPFKGFIGKVEKLNLEKGKAVVSLSIFGRETPTEIDVMSLEAL